VWFSRRKHQTTQAEACATKTQGERMDATELWKRYRQYSCRVDSLDLSLDISRMHFDEVFLTSMEPAMQKAFKEMDVLKVGRSPIPTKNEWWGITGCARRNSRQRRISHWK
jgi:hypothetical protein